MDNIPILTHDEQQRLMNNDSPPPPLKRLRYIIPSLPTSPISPIPSELTAPKMELNQQTQFYLYLLDKIDRLNKIIKIHERIMDIQKEMDTIKEQEYKTGKSASELK